MAEFTNDKSYSTLSLSIVTLGMYKKEGSEVGFEILIQTIENNDHSSHGKIGIPLRENTKF